MWVWNLTFLVFLMSVSVPEGDVRSVRTASESFPTMSGAIDGIASNYKVSVGIEYATNGEDRTPITLDLSLLQPATALDSLVAQKPGYTWNFDHGVYDVYPKEHNGSILDLKIRMFSVHEATPQEISAAIDELPEVKQWMGKNQVRRGEFQVNGSRWDPSDRRVSLTIRGSTLRSILNRIVVETGRTRWTVGRDGDNAESIGIYI
jgi:hypothetical protein